MRCVIVTGAGEKSFIAGADINELAALRPTQGKEHAQRGQHVLDLIENMGKPVIAAINGFCLGGGFVAIVVVGGATRFGARGSRSGRGVPLQPISTTLASHHRTDRA